MVKNFSKLVGSLLLLLSLAHAQQARVYKDGDHWAQEITGSLAAAKNLRVKVDLGGVRIEGGARTNIGYVIRNRAYTSSEETARRQFNSYKISASVRGDTAWLVAEWVGGRPRKFSGEFVLQAPRNLESVKVETQGGGLITTGIAGRVDAQTGGGVIRLDDIGGAINAETGGGGIDVGTVGGDLNLRTGGGDIRIGSAKGRVSAESGGGSVVLLSGLQGAVLETGGGNIQVKQCGGKLKVSTGGGSIDVGDVGGPAEIETGGGSIRVTSAQGSVRTETGGGSIELKGVPGARAETGAGGILARFVAGGGDFTASTLETNVGDITVYLAPELRLTVRASVELANGHGIRTDFPEIKITTEGGEWGPKTITAEGQLNGGGPILKVRTTTGNITFFRASR